MDSESLPLQKGGFFRDVEGAVPYTHDLNFYTHKENGLPHPANRFFFEKEMKKYWFGCGTATSAVLTATNAGATARLCFSRWLYHTP